MIGSQSNQKQEDTDMLFLFFIICLFLFRSSGGSGESYEESYEDSGANTALGIGAVLIGSSMIESAYRREIEAEAERQRLLGDDPMAEFRI